ncbi:Protein IQ-DOMAIN 1 [Vitis vinifera]|uniref:Protein IQ-DOMAIN 1 n=1 Tax=Vitis vinifera TaxID=29760 RepID=A0A438E5A5_VITVI|nr:Protein IQ-DOMAIN 1 [Vitis vinifera]
MGAGGWFKMIISLRKVKDDRSKPAKVHSTTEKSSNSKGKHHTDKELSSLANGALGKSAGVHKIPVEERAAIQIQTTYRAYKARKNLHRLRGTVRFQVMTQGDIVRKQASTTLSYIHAWSRIQAQISARRHCMAQEGRVRQKKLENQLKLEAKLHELEVEWCGGSETMEEILSRIQQREEAAVKRERAMAYAFSHQWRANNSQYLGHTYYDLGKENWGWSWMERWIAARPWETRVHAQSTLPKKAQTKHVIKVGKITNPQTMKTPVLVRPALSNGKGTTKPAAQEAVTTAVSSSRSEAEEANTKHEQIIT